MSDLISREAVLEVIRTTGVASAQEKLRIIAAVRAVPTVEAEPVVHAHWLTNDDPRGWFGKTAYCSACKCGDSTVRSPRCRYCGAHMDENLEIRTAYCPLCDKHFEVRSDDSMGSCPDCGHHVVLHREGEEDV
jgi:DNA-directed RNA polymerase subunit RPC12/RpoP